MDDDDEEEIIKYIDDLIAVFEQLEEELQQSDT